MLSFKIQNLTYGFAYSPLVTEFCLSDCYLPGQTQNFSLLYQTPIEQKWKQW